MPDRSTARAGQAAPTVTDPAHLRNVVLIGCSGAGKTTLAESLALAAGAIGRTGRVSDGTTVSDHEEIEHQQQRSVQLSLLPLEWNGIKVNLLDPPGHPDFSADLRAALHAADAAVFVVSATDPVTSPTRALWRECAAEGIPRAIAVAKLDIARSSFDDILTACHDAFGLGPDTLRPLFLPVQHDGHPDGSVDLLTGHTYGQTEPLPDTAPARDSLVEAISGQDDTLMERYLAGDTLDTDSLEDGMRREVLACTLHPAVPTTDAGLGAAELLDLITTAFPDPTQRTRPAPECDPDAPLAAQVVRVTGDAYVGRISLLRIYAGTLRPDTRIHLTGPDHPGDQDGDERVTGLTSPFGKLQRSVPHAVAGDLVCAAKLTSARAGDTAHEPGHPVKLDTWTLPEPLLPIAIEAHSKADDDKLSQALARLAAEDPALRLEQNPDTHQLVLWCTGEAHADVVLDRLRSRHGVHVDTVEPRVALRETFGTAAAGHGRLVKQSGGHGQYAICDLEVEPLPAGAGFEFDEHVVGGAVPKHFIPSVEKGVRAQLAKGVSTGYPLVDVRVTLTDGKAHSVDSSDSSFQTAAALALRDAAEHAVIRLLEPVAAVSVLLPDDYLGAVLTDLSARRGRVLGTETGGPALTLLRAEVPELELVRYPVDLRSLTHGTAEFSRAYLRHEPMPAALATRYTEGRARS
ncbi:elongation factor G-like protein EF-G2 [Kitasatospora sp. CM 4170]|uniref:Elongation factor G-like protein EF-G2 n=1 Tax=Kitasatospora aburaviensis TaxID=67265 RepID=A0ABW1ETH3_9ACTN|nr:elongation factor G-like protein EF-G2 [Kitasatospora sp. CM 4170]WNM44921.1 elongation factor G-like protein EF-G2 [Kitasatospora sp. CM 4170]